MRKHTLTLTERELSLLLWVTEAYTSHAQNDADTGNRNPEVTRSMVDKLKGIGHKILDAMYDPL